MVRRIYLAQINSNFGNNAFLPYSTALLWSYVRTQQDLMDSFQLGGMLFLREGIEQSLSRMSDPGVFAVSTYIWNWQYSMQLISAVRRRWPSCVIIIGGPEAPSDSVGFLEQYPDIDYIVHGEGELTFAALLRCIRDRGDPAVIDGISYLLQGRTVRNSDRKRIEDVNIVPSPYMDGVMDDLVRQHPQLSWHASQETHRGCPYSCTFCDWGSAVYTKVRAFDTDRLIAEMAWFGENKIDLLYNVDANYGIYKRDVELTKALVAVKSRYDGFPSKFRASYAKKSDDKVFEIAQLLNSAGMSKGITLSMQSMDPHTLEIIKRKNIAVDDLRSLLARYRKHDIPAYTEMILGLPGETLDSWQRGLESILEHGQHDNLNIYLCMVLRNSEMARPEYMRRHGIIKSRVPVTDNHRSSSEDDITEWHDIVIATKDMPHAEWRQAYLIGWMVQSLHCLGLTQTIAKMHKVIRGDYLSFYRDLLRLHDGKDTVLGRQIAMVNQRVDAVLNGAESWGTADDLWGPIAWPMEELTFLQIKDSPQQFYDELREHIATWLDATRMDELIDLQTESVLGPHHDADTVRTYTYDWLALEQGQMPEPRATKLRLAAPRYFAGDRQRYAQEIVWYGRKQALHKRRMEISC